jgi:hypothetical protein
MELISAASNMSVAASYAREESWHGVTTSRVRVFDNGPYWVQPLRSRPKTVVLTKTHCGGYRYNRPLSESIETAHLFPMLCASAFPTDFKRDASHSGYGYDKVNRAIHLIRDPLDNLVARYHYFGVRLDEARYTRDAKGFARFCAEKDSMQSTGLDLLLDPQILNLTLDIPCHVDLFRYVLWHNSALNATEQSFQVPTLVVHYEDYASDFEGTLESTLKFLELHNVGQYANFQKGKSYRDYFTEEQVARVRSAIMMLSLPITWRYLERYF